METKMSVRDLRISFRTTNGKVQAVRGINFDLAKGETLAIVGESGSGKSVTSKAILGIQAGNAITESGEIIYDGQDLLKINEEAFHKIRGDKIAMIFQDPMSSLNPIVKIGKQLTEAMILKGKARQRESKQIFTNLLKELNTAMTAAVDTFVENCILGITANEEKCYNDVERSTGPVTAMAPYIGYQRSAAIAKESLKTGTPVREIILRDGIMTEEELNKLLDARAMTEPRKITTK